MVIVIPLDTGKYIEIAAQISFSEYRGDRAFLADSASVVIQVTTV